MREGSGRLMPEQFFMPIPFRTEEAEITEVSYSFLVF